MSAPKLKQQKIDPEDSGVDEKVQALESIQDEVEKLNDEATEEILQVERKYNAKRKPYYKRRNEIIREIPDFWLKVVSLLAQFFLYVFNIYLYHQFHLHIIPLYLYA